MGNADVVAIDVHISNLWRMATGLVLVVVGVVLISVGWAELTNHRGLADWWVRYAQRQRQLFGRFWGPRYDRSRTQSLASWTIALGVIFVVVGGSNV